MPDSSSSSADNAHADIGIVCALNIEIAPFLDRCEKLRKYKGDSFVFRGGRYGDIKIAVVETGTGFARARRATQALIDAHSPPWIISAGFSGALLPEMKLGQIVVADTLCDTHGQEMKWESNMPADPSAGLYVGRILNTDEIVRTVEEKKQLGQQFQALAVDLESLAVAQVAHERHKNYMAVRVISDDMSADLPPEVLSVLGATGTYRVGAAMGALWKRPAAAKDLWKLRESANFAAGRLALFLDGVVAQLFEAEH